ncbi:PQQ-like domain-containing protein [Streptomyces sp. TLI_105]|nr:PQQ-like domain-containing protein [Streptomyces sp. TLI_105]
MSADPPTVRGPEAEGGLSAVLAFAPDGRLRTRIDAGGGYGRIHHAVVEDGRLFAVTATESGRGALFSGVVAFDLASGAELWRKDAGDAALDVTDGRVTMVRPGCNGDLMFGLDAATGDEEDEQGFRDRWVTAGSVLTYQDLVIVVRGGGKPHPFSVYERW